MSEVWLLVQCILLAMSVREIAWLEMIVKCVSPKQQAHFDFEMAQLRLADRLVDYPFG